MKSYDLLVFEIGGRKFCAMNNRALMETFLKEASKLLGKTPEELEPRVKTQLMRSYRQKVDGKLVDEIRFYETRQAKVADYWIIEYEG